MGFLRRLAKHWLPADVLERLRMLEYRLGYRRLRWRHAAAAARSGIRARRRILFYPELPRASTLLYRVSASLGYAITNNPDRPCDLAVKWEIGTRSPAFEALERLAQTQRVVNRHCDDISKERVGEAFACAFGYSIAVDPTLYEGPCVEKSDLNALHDGRIVSCPLPTRTDGCVYQRLVDNRVDDEVVDFRLPVIGSRLPLVYLRYRPVDRRFRAGNARVDVAHLYEVFDQDEVLAIQRFRELLRLEYGELDILRDRADGRIYVVDANNTPYGPPSGIDPRDGERVIQLLGAAFAAEFIGIDGREWAANGRRPPSPQARTLLSTRSYSGR